MSINWLHPAEMVTAFAVGSGIFAGGYALMRVMFAGSTGRREVPMPLPIKQYSRILIPTGAGMSQTDYLNEATTLACQLADKTGPAASELIFLYVIPVPRALALTAAMPDEEAVADRVLNAAAESARARGVTRVTKQTRKGRTVEDETIKAVEQEHADLVVLTPQTNGGAGPGVAFAGGSDMLTASAAYTGANEPACEPRCHAELDTVETSDRSETVTGKLLRRLPCEAMVARRGNGSIAVPLVFARA